MERREHTLAAGTSVKKHTIRTALPALLLAGLSLILLGCTVTTRVPGVLAAAEPTPGPQLASQIAPTVAPVYPDTPVETLSEFFKWYTLFPGNPLERRAYRFNQFLRPYLTSDFVERVDRTLTSFDGRGAYDPFVCGQDLPSEFEYELVSAEDDAAQVLVHRYYTNNPQPADMMVKLVRVGNTWRIDDITCWLPSAQDVAVSVTRTLTPTTTPTETSTPVPGTWHTYHNFSHGFRLQYPAGWYTLETHVSDLYDDDPVDGYLLFNGQGRDIPVTLMMSSGTMQDFRLYFPVEGGSSDTQLLNGYEVLVEEPFSGERYYTFQHPEDDERRVTLRVISRDKPIDEEMQAVLDWMLSSFAFEH